MLESLLILFILALIGWTAVLLSNPLILYIADGLTIVMIIYLIIRVRTKIAKGEKERLRERVKELEEKLKDSEKSQG
ncbi:MAG TPA: hypothetical protein EYP58_03930 [bacterium (Candidatus Stahlbacteria)]|nr:hypothetical protein [Candidatus Stahlbacteria bacterium]